jgi:RNA polymerase sigma-70 factor, ECF subfamily
MSTNDPHLSSKHVLAQILNPDDNQAWKMLVDRYAPCVYHYCRIFGLQKEAADEIFDNWLFTFWQKVRAGTFRYDPTATDFNFRSYLYTWIKNDIFKANNTKQGQLARGTGDTDIRQRLENVSDPRPNKEDPDCEHFCDLALLELAMQLLPMNFSDRDCKIFRLSTSGELSGKDVAKIRDMNVGAVHKVKSRIREFLCKTVLLLPEALCQVRPRIEPIMWKAFHLAVHQASDEIAAADLQLDVIATHESCDKIRNLLHAERKRLSARTDH